MKRPAALVVVRDPSVRTLAVQVLEEQGFEVAASDGSANAASLPDTADTQVVLVDLDGPQPPGPSWLARLHGSTRVVALTDGELAGAGIRPRSLDVLRKPIDREHLARVARHALGELRPESAAMQPTPLGERPEDVAALAAAFVAEICEINQLPPIRISSSALSLLEDYAWPGDVEELRGAIEQAVIVSSDEIIRPGDLPEAIRETSAAGRPRIPAGVSARPFREAKRAVVNEFEKVYLGELLERHRGNVTAAAQHAGMLRSALQRLLRKYRLKSADFRRGRRVARPSASKPADDPR